MIPVIVLSIIMAVRDGVPFWYNFLRWFVLCTLVYVGVNFL